MAHLILTGATGLVGSAALAHALSLPAGNITKLSILSRRPVPMAEGRSNVEVLIQKDFSKFEPDVLAKLKGADGCIWAQGISVTQVTKEEYRKITIDYPLAAAEAFSSLSGKFKFVYVSGEGATTKPGSFTPHFGQIKGQAELALLALASKTPSLRPYSLRLGVVDSHSHPEVIVAMASKPAPFFTRLMQQSLLPPIRNFFPNMLSPTAEAGKFMVDLALSDGEPMPGADIEGEGRILNNKAIRRLVKEGVLEKEGRSAFD